MELKPIRIKREYEAGLNRAEALWDAPAGSREAEQLDVLVLLIEVYETRHFPILPPDPVEFLQFNNEQRGLARKDLEPYIA